MSHRQSSALLVLLALASVCVAPPPVVAAESDAVLLPRPTAAAITVDLDGDGAREVVRIAESDRAAVDAGVDLVVEAWQVRGGSWSILSSVPLTRPAAEGGAAVPVDSLTDAFALVAWRREGRERALVVTGAGPDLRGGSTSTVCCVTLAEATLDARRLDLTPLDEFDGFAESILAVDLDADANDELVLGAAGSRDSQAYATVLRWTGSSFEPQRVIVGWGTFGAHPTIVGDTDDVPGDEVLYGPADDGSLVRVGAGDDGHPFVESASGFGRGEMGNHPWFFGAGGGRLFARMPSTLSAWAWPRGGEPKLMAQLRIPDSSLVHVLSAESRAIVVQTADPLGRGTQPAVRVYGSDLTTLAEADGAPSLDALVSVSPRALRNLSRTSFPIDPQVGRIPGGLPDGSAAFVSMGNLVTLDASRAVGVEPIGGMAGTYPLGLAGPGGEWMAVSDGSYGNGGALVFLTVAGGHVGDLSLVPTDAILSRDGAGTVAVVADGLVRDPTGAGWISGPDGMTVSIDVPAASSVAAFIEDSVVLEIAEADGPIEAALPPPRGGSANRAYRASVAVVTVNGHVHVETWDVLALREAPELSATAQTRTGEMVAVVRGDASAHATVLVDGEPVPRRADGSFETDVDASLWPRDVRVVARDPFGGEATLQLSVVGGFDYRGLPWALIVAAVTVLCGAWLYLRTPHPVPSREALADDDGATLEDVG